METETRLNAARQFTENNTTNSHIVKTVFILKYRVKNLLIYFIQITVDKILKYFEEILNNLFCK